MYKNISPKKQPKNKEELSYNKAAKSATSGQCLKYCPSEKEKKNKDLEKIFIKNKKIN